MVKRTVKRTDNEANLICCVCARDTVSPYCNVTGVTPVSVLDCWIVDHMDVSTSRISMISVQIAELLVKGLRLCHSTP